MRRFQQHLSGIRLKRSLLAAPSDEVRELVARISGNARQVELAPGHVIATDDGVQIESSCRNPEDLLLCVCPMARRCSCWVMG